jgi:hypothetical protein
MKAAASILMVELKGFFEISICLNQNTRMHIPDFNNFTHSPGDLKSRLSHESSHERQSFQVVSSHHVLG